MKVHHLNCGTMRVPTAPIVCHVLLVETGNGLVLVDTGFGLDDVADPRRRIGPTWRMFCAALDPAETAVRQVEGLGFHRDDVRHIVVTHADLDHIGGLSDFPAAQVHLTSAEVDGAMRAPSWREKLRFRAVQWAHGPRIVEHTPTGEAWRGFAAAQELTDIAPGIVLLALPGHTRGHAAVAVDAGHRWVLHAGDAFYGRGTLDGGSSPAVLRAMETTIAHDLPQVRRNHARLAELHRRAEPDLLIVSAHDPVLFDRAQATQ